jgi:glutamate-1-semialdehyde 2,1-aminomutase/spore coat polysaccharide biosynthesis protein SpsF
VRFDRSQELWARAQRVIPLGTQTLSKSPTQFVQGAVPIYLERGRGSHVWDADGNEWIDYPMALGPVILGYAEPVVDEAIRAQLDDGITFTLMHPLEVEVAERIVAICPGVEAVRFGKSGSDALSAAVRVARAHTGRDLVLAGGYHGWHDWYIGTTTRDLGVPHAVAALTDTFHFNDLDELGAALDRHEGRVAAVVLEPSGAEVPAPGYLEQLTERTRAAGAISIFDEVITGFRLAPGGARERYGVIPDISCYGKALGNGMPIAAVAGSWAVMKAFEDVFFSGTHGGEALSLAAARAVLDTIADGRVLADIETRGERMLGGVRALIEEHRVADQVTVGGEPQRAVLGFGSEDQLVVKSYVQQTLAQHGCLFNGSMFICARHTDDDIDRALGAFAEAFATLGSTDDVSDLLVGPPVQAVFRTP